MWFFSIKDANFAQTRIVLGVRSQLDLCDVDKCHDYIATQSTCQIGFEIYISSKI